MSRVIFELLDTKIEHFEDEIEHHPLMEVLPPFVEMAIHYDNRLQVAEYIVTAAIPRYADVVFILLEGDHIYGKKSDVVRKVNEMWDEDLADYIKRAKLFEAEGIL